MGINFVLAHPGLSDVADQYLITGGGGAATNAPGTNLQRRQPKLVFQSNNVLTTIDIRLDLGASASYDLMALLFTNANAAATVTWDGNAADSTFVSASTWTSGSRVFVAPGMSSYSRTHGFYLIPTTQTAQYVRARVVNPTNAEGVFRAGRIYCSKTFRPAIKFGSVNIGFDDDPHTTITSSNERITRASEPIPVLSFTVLITGVNAKTTFYSQLYEIMRLRGAAKDVLAIVDADDASYVGPMMYYGTLQQRTQVELPAYNYYSATFEIRGLI